MCVFFIFFTPVESNSKCIFHPHHPLFTPQIPHKKIPILKNHMCILSLINKFSAISAQILFTLHKSSKIHHNLYLHSTNSPYRSINRRIGNLFFFLGGDLGMVGGIGIFVVKFLFQIGY